MSAAGLLPRRWRHDPQRLEYLEAIAHVLDTPPIVPSAAGLAIFTEIGTADVLPLLVAAKSLYFRLRRGRFLLCGDRTLTGADRAILAHHLGDPEFAPCDAAAGFPAGLPWRAIVTALARRRGEYCLILSPLAVTCGPLSPVEHAFAANRSFAAGDCPGALLGFAAGGPPPPVAARFRAALGGDLAPATQQRLLLAREIEPVLLGPETPLAVPRHEQRIATSRAAIAALA